MKSYVLSSLVVATIVDFLISSLFQYVIFTTPDVWIILGFIPDYRICFDFYSHGFYFWGHRQLYSLNSCCF